MSLIPDDVRAESKQDLWRTILSRVEQLPRGYGSSRSQAFYSETGFSITCLCLYTAGQGDGSDVVYHIEAHRDHRFMTESEAGEVRVQINTYVDNHDSFWAGKLKENSSRRVIVGGKYFSLGDETPYDGALGRGFGGRRFKIKMNDAGSFTHKGRTRSWNAGEVIETTNLWSAGRIPPAWRDRLPDNAEFLEGWAAW